MKKQLLIVSSLLFGFSALAQQTPVSQSVQKRIVVLEELTGINCQYCPDGHRIANLISANNPGKVVLVNIHAGSFAPTTGQYNFTTAAGNALNTFFNPTGYPAGAVNRWDQDSDGRIATGRGNWTSMSNTLLGQDSEVNVAMNATIDVNTRVLTVNVEMFYTSPFASGTNHYLNVGIAQNNIESPHTGSAYNPDQILPNGNYNNMHMFRMFVNGDDNPFPTPKVAWGDAIDASQTGVITKTYTVTLPNSVGPLPLEFGELELFAYVHHGRNTAATSRVLSGAKIAPTYINAPVATGNLVKIIDDFNVQCNTTGTITPNIQVKNTGDQINSISFSYSVNGGTPSTYTYNGTIATFANANITLPAITFPVAASNNSLSVTITSVNGGSGNVGTATLTKNIAAAGRPTNPNITLNVYTDNYPGETTWQLRNAANQNVATGGPYQGNGNNAGGPDALQKKSHAITLPGTGCFNLRIADSYGDGLSIGTNPFGGVGFSIDDNLGNEIYNMQRASWDFGTQVVVTGVLVGPSGVDVDEQSIVTAFNVYPNPTNGQTNIYFSTSASTQVNVMITNSLGEIVRNQDLGIISNARNIVLDTEEFASGIYYISVIANGEVNTKVLSVIK
jgi:hypothetical protein